MLWLKTFHIIAMVTWFAGLFYLPRLYVYHANEKNRATIDLFKIMERRLFILMTIGGTLTAILVVWMFFNNGAYYLSQAWFHAKLFFILALLAYHLYCYRLMLTFREDKNRRNQRWYRLFNEIPSLLLIAIIILVVVKPF